MTIVHHINCGTLQVPPNPAIACHCLLLQDRRGLALVDTGIGLQDVAHPDERLGRELIDRVGFRFDEADTAVRRIERLGLSPDDVRHIVLTHADPDHTGGLADFPRASVHLSAEEHASIARGHWRYVPAHFAHAPAWCIHDESVTRDWFGLPARPLPLDFDAELLLVPLPGHTLGHCGIAVRRNDRWLLHVGDAYYLRVEMVMDDHPVSRLTAQVADDDAARRASLRELRRLLRDHADEIDLFGYHDPTELPGGLPRS